MKKILNWIVVGILMMGLVVGAGGCGKNNAGDKSKIRVGMKNFTENLIVGEIYALALEDGGYKVERVPNIASSVIHASITNNEIDLYPEYTGTGLLSVLKMNLMTDPKQVYQTVKDEYKKQFNIVWLNYSSANDGQGIVIRTDVAKKYGIKTISDLQVHAKEIRFVSQGEFDQREDGIPGLRKMYGPFQWKSTKVYDNGLKYSVMENDEGDAAPAYTTEGQLLNQKFTLLEDDKHVWPPYNMAPIVRQGIVDAHPSVVEILNKISAGLTTEKLTKLNGMVDIDKREYEEVAKDYYQSVKGK
ncbi:glycine betaine ABC transporter substrate-binding protein [Pelosinus sp. sgz500959]|uniref:glycine betaine ABC transporter substrate-binding protein n=1 Tax=Pelosinus sp. sgz500959 TaxID=3242472 RepID=UPI00367171F9